MPRTTLAPLILILASTLGAVRPAAAGPVYVALGDSITFGETNLSYVPSDGDRGYVGLYANYLATLNGGVRPKVDNLAIDGETVASFTAGVGRVPPVTGRTDVILAAENTHYNAANPATQEATFLATVAAEKAAGNAIGTVSITLGFNDLSTALTSSTPVSQILATYRMQYAGILGEIRAQAPTANLVVLGYFNPFPADPASPAAPIFNTYGAQLNAIIQGLAAQYGATYVNTAPPFVGNEAALTYLAVQPHGSMILPPDPHPGTLPIGNVHPNAAGYAAIAAQVEAAVVPEPASVVLLATGCLVLLVAGRRMAGNLSASRI